jgi:Universal stress protein family
VAILFKNILVTVDFSDGSDIAFRKAIELSDPINSVVCILYLFRPRFVFSIFSSTGYLVAPATKILSKSEVQKNVKKYRGAGNQRAPGIELEAILPGLGSIQNKIEKAAFLFNPDLIIICRNDNRSCFPFFNKVFPDGIARKTNSLVLTIKKGSDSQGIKNIVLPVTWRVPFRKLEVAVSMAKKFNANIHLMTFPEFEPRREDAVKVFIDAFYKMRQYNYVSVKYGSLKGKNIARAILNYSISIHADIIMTNPETESSIHSLIGNRHISDLLPRNSSVQVLDVEPYFHFK